MAGGPLEGLLEEIYFEELLKIVTESEAITIQKNKKPPLSRNQEGIGFSEFMSLGCLEGRAALEAVLCKLETLDSYCRRWDAQSREKEGKTYVAFSLCISLLSVIPTG